MYTPCSIVAFRYCSSCDVASCRYIYRGVSENRVRETFLTAAKSRTSEPPAAPTHIEGQPERFERQLAFIACLVYLLLTSQFTEGFTDKYRRECRAAILHRGRQTEFNLPFRSNAIAGFMHRDHEIFLSETFRLRSSKEGSSELPAVLKP